MGHSSMINTRYRACPECTYPLKTYLDLDGEYKITRCTNNRCSYYKTRKVKKCQK